MKKKFTTFQRWMIASLLLVLTGILSIGPSQAAESGAQYTLTRQYGSVLFRVLHQDYLMMVGRFDDYAGTLTLDTDDLSDSRLQASVNMASLNMADGDVVETLISSGSWFNASLFPEATFTTSSVTVTGDNEADFIGELTFMGISKPWTLHIQFFGGNDGELTGSIVGMQATGSFNRLDFGLDQYRNMAADEVSIEINVKFNRD